MSSHPAGEPGCHVGWPSCLEHRRCGRGIVAGSHPTARRAETRPFPRRLEFQRTVLAQASGELDQRAIERAKAPPALEISVPSGGRPSAVGGSSPQWRASLVRDETRGRRARSEIEQVPARACAGPCCNSSCPSSSAARLVNSSVKRNLAVLAAADEARGRPRAMRHAPAGQRPGEFGHVGLPVAGARPERVKLDDLARQVLVEAALSPARIAAIRRPPDPGPADCAWSR